MGVIEAHYVPRLRDHLALRVTGSPTLAPAHVNLERRPNRNSLGNLWMANATAGMPSVAGAIGAGARLFAELRGG